MGICSVNIVGVFMGWVWENLGSDPSANGVAETVLEGLTHSFHAASKSASHLDVTIGNNWFNTHGKKTVPFPFFPFPYSLSLSFSHLVPVKYLFSSRARNKIGVPRYGY